MKGHTNIYFKQIAFFEKIKKQKIDFYFFLKKMLFFFNLGFLHLNNQKPGGNVLKDQVILDITQCYLNINVI